MTIEGGTSGAGIVDMTSSRPYLIRAIFEWISDNDLTPYLLVNAEAAGVQVPRQYIENGRIILNIGARAVQGLQQDEQGIRFSARFGGQKMEVRIPCAAVIAIYARENGRGMVLDQADGGSAAPAPRKQGRPHLQVVK